MPRKLKVFRTPTGFHDAYVAAPSRKAALEAWGAASDLFARGAAEEITDEGLMAEPLAHPGEVIYVSRGDLAAQLKALGPKRKPAKSQPEPKSVVQAKAPKPKPPPQRDKVDRAEAAVEQARATLAKERAALENKLDALNRKLEALDARHDKDLAELERKAEKARTDYRAALDEWNG